MISLDEGTVSAGQECGALFTGQASRCSILQHPVAGYPYSASDVQQVATNHFASFRRSSLPTSLGGPLTQTTADILVENLVPRRFSVTAGGPTDIRLHRWPQAGAQVNAPDSNCCGNRQSAIPSASLPYCSGHSNAGIEPMPAADAPAFIPSQQKAHTPRDPLPGLTIPIQQGQVGSASDASVGLAAESPFEPNQYCQQILASSGPGATSLTANQLSSTLAAAAAAAPLQSAGVRGNYRPRPCAQTTSMLHPGTCAQTTAMLHPGTCAPAVPQACALHSHPSVAPPESQAGARANLLQGLHQPLLNPAAAPKGPSAPAPAPGQLPAGWPLQGAERLTVASLPAFRSFSAGSVACGQAPNGHAHQRHPALAPGADALITPPGVDSNASKSNTSKSNDNVSRLLEVEVDGGGAFAVHTPTDGSSGARTAAGLPPPVTVQVASRSRRNGDGGNAASGRGRLTRGAVGLFHPELYLKGAECIECGTEMMSRGRFERLAGTATAKWHVSIKVLPSGMTLGKWLQKHGLPILQGRPRKRRADHQDEGANEEGEENSGLQPGFCGSAFNPLASLWLQGTQDAAAAAAALAAASGAAAVHMMSQATITTTAAGAEGGVHPVTAAWNHQTATEREVDGAPTGHCASEAEDDPLATLFDCPEILDVLEASDTPGPVQDARVPAPGKPRCLPPGRTLLPGNRPPGATAMAPGLMSSGNGQDSFSRPAVSPETAVGSRAMGMVWSGVPLGSVGAGVGSPPVAAMPAGDSLSPADFPARQSGTSVSSIQTMGSGAASGGSLPMAGWHDAGATPQVDGTGHGCWGVAWREQGATAAAAPLVPASAQAGLGVSNQASHFHFLSLDARLSNSRLSTSGGASLAHPALDGVSDSRSAAHGVAAVAPAYQRLAPQDGSGTDWPCSGSDVSPGNSRQNSCVSLLEPWGPAGPNHHTRSHEVLGAGGAPLSSAPIKMPHVHCLMAPGPAAPQAAGSLLYTAGVAVNGGGGGVLGSAGGRGLLLQLGPPMVPRGCSQYHVFTSQEQQQQQQSMAASWRHFSVHQLQVQAAQAPGGGWLAPQSV